ncbi:MAG: hypothetical protein D4R64_09085 [Porphyromonadaceae bacterium]|nr:MAG: hypothetical protein D4R64_09085 [Porphyromonadaceae bacterium]
MKIIVCITIGFLILGLTIIEAPAQHLAPFSSNLPLTIIQSPVKENLPLAFFVSGDGGWARFEKAVCEKLVENGISVVGLDAKKYFWKEKQPKEAAEDITKVIEYYMQQWNKNSFVLVGYSFGASVVPFIANNFSYQFSSTGIRFETLPDSHHYGNNYQMVAEIIYKDFIRGD